MFNLKKPLIFQKNGFIGITDINGNVILPPDKYIEAKAEDFHIGRLRNEFCNGVIPVSKPNGETGYIDTEGNIALPFVYEDAYPFIDGKAVVKKNGKFGMIDREGNTVIPFRYDMIIYNGCSDEKEELICVSLNKKFGYVTPDGTISVPIVFDNHIAKCSGYFTENVAPVVQNGEKFFIDRSGKIVITPCENFDFIGSFENGFAMVIRYTPNNKIMHGYINKSGKLAVPVQYTQIGCFYSEGLIGVSFNGKTVYTDKAGNVVLETPYDKVTDYHGGIAWGAKNGRWQSFDRTGKVLASDLVFDWMIPCDDGTWIISSEGKRNRIDAYGKMRYEFKTVPDCPYLNVSESDWSQYWLETK